MRLGGVAAAGPPGMTEYSSRPLSFKYLKGWARDDQSIALVVFRKSCGEMAGAAWAAVCGRAKYVAPEAARTFFEQNFQPVLIDGHKPTLFTGHYEPEIPASPVRTPNFAYPTYRKLPELKPGMIWYDRATIENRGLLRGRGLEIAWLHDPVDVFSLQVQGSGCLLMPDGTTMRVEFSAKNGQPYRSVGMELVRRGIYTRGQASAQGIRAWVQAHPFKGPEILQYNPSFIFFRKLHLPEDTGPIGAMALPVTPGRTLSVIPLGAPVWIASCGSRPLHRLMVAQDARSAIKGAHRAHIFIGSGPKVGDIARHMRDRGLMVVLLPKPAAATVMEASN